MDRIVGFATVIALGLVLPSTTRAAAHRATAATEAKGAYKAQLHTAKLVKAQASGPGPVPAHFNTLSPQVRLAYLLARREVAPARFDFYHPKIGPLLGVDERVRAGQSQANGLNGIFPNTPLTRYLHYRRGLNPTRFDFYHPGLGALLAEDDRLKAIGAVGGQTISPPPVTSGGSTDPGTPGSGDSSGGNPGTPGAGDSNGGPPITGSAVPEPASMVLFGLGSLMVGSTGMRRWLKTGRKATK